MAKDHSHCSGCSLCLLACPVWRQCRDIRLTPHGRAKAIQNGAASADITASVASCTLCGACEPACPENIPLVDLMLDLRRASPLAASASAPAAGEAMGGNDVSVLVASASRFGERLPRMAALLDCAIAADPGEDIAHGLECGLPLPEGRLEAFLYGLRGASSLVVADGLLFRRLRDWLPLVRVTSLGEALTSNEHVRSRLQARDLYVIEARAFHADHARLVRYYDALRRSKGLATNLDLQRLAIPTATSAAQHALGLPVIDAKDQARWILEGYSYERVVVEDPADCAVFAGVTGRPVVHLADL